MIDHLGLIEKYLIYIIVSFFTYPFAKLFLDRLGIYTLREKIDKQTGVTYYFYQTIFFFDSLLYHSSIYLAPLGLLVLIIDLIIKKFAVKRTMMCTPKVKSKV